MKKINLKVYFILLCWSIPILTAISTFSNISKSATEKNKTTLISSIPEHCELKDEVLKCNDNTYSENTIKFIQDLKIQTLNNIEDSACRLMVVNENKIKNLLPTMYFKPSEDYQVVIVCFEQKKVYNNLLEYSATQINKKYAELQGCKKEFLEKSTVLNLNGNFSLANEGVQYFCENESKIILSEKELFKQFFIQECSLRILDEKDNPFKTCENLYVDLTDSKLRKANSLSNKILEEMDFLNNLRNEDKLDNKQSS